MENKNMTVLKWSVGILAILNIILLLNTWRSSGHPMPPRPPMHHGSGGPAKMIIEELKLSPDQIKTFEKLKEAHHSSMLELQSKGRELRGTYFDLLKQESPDQKTVDELATAIAGNQKAIETVTFEHFKEVRTICTEEQKKHFDEIIGDIIRGMAGPHRGEGPPPH
jgi:protein CpxP